MLQPLVHANVPSISKKTVPGEGRTQWRLGPKRGHFGGRLGDGAYVPTCRRTAASPGNSTGGMKSDLRNVHQQHSMPAARHLVPMTKQPPVVVLKNTVRDAEETEYAGQSVY
jgi:hypothetical protein